MVVEPGSVVVQVVDFRRQLVRLDLPPDLLVREPPQHVGLLALSANPSAQRGILASPEPDQTSYPVEAHLAGPAPRLDVASQFASYWYEVRLDESQETNAKTAGPGVMWRPGLQVTAYVPGPNAQPREAVAVPVAAVLFHQGRALVYVCRAPGKYERREVSLLGREGNRWVLSRRQGKAPAGMAPNEAVVYRQAQVLLSEEFRGEGDND
jgi:hypothetical protein